MKGFALHKHETQVQSLGPKYFTKFGSHTHTHTTDKLLNHFRGTYDNDFHYVTLVDSRRKKLPGYLVPVQVLKSESSSRSPSFSLNHSGLLKMILLSFSRWLLLLLSLSLLSPTQGYTGSRFLGVFSTFNGECLVAAAWTNPSSCCILPLHIEVLVCAIYTCWYFDIL